MKVSEGDEVNDASSIDICEVAKDGKIPSWSREKSDRSDAVGEDMKHDS
jgi:hypothetical protein